MASINSINGSFVCKECVPIVWQNFSSTVKKLKKLCVTELSYKTHISILKKKPVNYPSVKNWKIHNNRENLRWFLNPFYVLDPLSNLMNSVDPFLEYFLKICNKKYIKLQRKPIVLKYNYQKINYICGTLIEFFFNALINKM